MSYKRRTYKKRKTKKPLTKSEFSRLSKASKARLKRALKRY